MEYYKEITPCEYCGGIAVKPDGSLAVQVIHAPECCEGKIEQVIFYYRDSQRMFLNNIEVCPDCFAVLPHSNCPVKDKGPHAHFSSL